MKICPSCNQTYDDDSLVFCLVDGSVLSAPRHSYETLRIPEARSTEAPPTEVLPPSQRPDAPPASTQPTIPASGPLSFQAVKPAQAERKRAGRSWLLLSMVLLLGIVIGAVIAAGLIKFGTDKPEDTPQGSPADYRSASNIANTSANLDSPELPGQQWEECEIPDKRPDIRNCGIWTRVPYSALRWRALWAPVKAELSITASGKSVTVKRRDSTSSLEATYYGTLNSDNTQITGTVDWCCDQLGNRSGTWHARRIK